MSPLSRRSSRLIWGWCLTYTAVAPAMPRERRRGEIRSHLWESERAALPRAAVVLTAIRGLLADLGWAATCGLPRLGRSLLTPTPYVVLAPLFPLEGWIVSAVATGSAAGIGEAVGGLGGGAMLALAGSVWLLRRTRG
jgi:hypothetical protein